MIAAFIILGCIIGGIIGMNSPIISYTYSSYLAIGIIAAIDTIIGGIASAIKQNFNVVVFVSGFFGNAILSILLVFLGEKLNVDIFLAAIVVFVNRMFINLTKIRRHYIDEWMERKSKSEEK